MKNKLTNEQEKRFEGQKKKWEEKGYDLLWEDLEQFLADELALRESEVREEIVSVINDAQEAAFEGGVRHVVDNS